MKKLIIAIMLLIGVTAFMSCNEKSSSVVENEFTQPIVYTINPLEDVGIEHNVLLTEFVRLLAISDSIGEFDNLIYPSNDFTTKLAELTNQTYLNMYQGSTSSSSYWVTLYNDMSIDTWYTDSGDVTQMFQSAETELIANATYQDSMYCMNFLNDFKTLINSTSNNSLDDLYQLIILHENSILNQSWDSTETYALGMIAVAKHSCLFWNDYFPLFTPPIFNKQPSLQGTAVNEETKQAVVVASDVVGAIVGTIKGAAAGTVMAPGAGTVAGMYVGKVAGGFLASSTALGVIAVVNFWGDLFSD